MRRHCIFAWKKQGQTFIEGKIDRGRKTKMKRREVQSHLLKKNQLSVFVMFFFPFRHYSLPSTFWNSCALKINCGIFKAWNAYFKCLQFLFLKSTWSLDWCSEQTKIVHFKLQHKFEQQRNNERVPERVLFLTWLVLHLLNWHVRRPLCEAK